MNNGDVYQLIQDRIVDMLQNGKIPWKCPYQTINGMNCRCFSHGSQRPYSLLNQMILSEPGEYWTYKQAKDAGYHVKRGAKSEKIYFWKVLHYVDGAFTPSCDDPSLRSVPLLKYYSVFHESQIEGLPERVEEVKPDIEETIPEADAIIERYIQSQNGLRFEHDDSSYPFYSPGRDLICSPRKVQFNSIPEYYSTVFHEMVHSTGHKNRLNRLESENDLTRKQRYSREELVAEMGSSALCSQLGFTEDIMQNQAAYCSSWLTSLQDNPRWIVWAASRAEAAVRYIKQEQTAEATESEE